MPKYFWSITGYRIQIKTLSTPVLAGCKSGALTAKDRMEAGMVDFVFPEDTIHVGGAVGTGYLK